MAASWIIVATSLAIASSQYSSPWQTKHGIYIDNPNANPSFYQWVSPAQAAIHQASVRSQIAREAAAQLTNPQHSYGQQITPVSTQHSLRFAKSPVNPFFYNSINSQQNIARQECPGCFDEPQTLEEAVGWRNANPQCPGPYCSSAQSFDDVIVVQATPKSRHSLGRESSNIQCPGPHCPYVEPQPFEDSITVQVSPRNQYTSGWRKANPQCPGPFCSYASPLATVAVLEDGTPVAVVPTDAKTLANNNHCDGPCPYAQPQSFEDSIDFQAIPKSQLSPGWRNANPQCPGPYCSHVQPESFKDAIVVQASPKNIQASPSLATPFGPQQLNPASSLSTLAVLDDGTPVAVVPAGAQSPVLAVNPQNSAKFTAPHQSHAQPTTTSSTHVFEISAPIKVVPAQPKTFEPAQPVLAIIPQEASVSFANVHQATQVPSQAEVRAQLFGAPSTLVPLHHQAPAQVTIVPTPTSNPFL